MLCHHAQESDNGVPQVKDLPVYYGRGGKFTSKPRIVVIGSGWGAISFIKSLSRRDRQAVLHLFLDVKFRTWDCIWP